MVTALYARTSTLNQATGLESQIRALTAYTETSPAGAPHKLFTDETSGRKDRRPGLDALMAEVRAGAVSKVVVYSLSRFSRSVPHLLTALDEFAKLGVGFVSLTESLDTATPTGRAVITIISAIAQLEADLNRERVRNGLANARAKGRRLGAPPRHADKLELMILLSAKGHSHREIARLVHASQSTVSRCLKKRA